MENPVVAADGYTYEESEIKKWLDENNRISPITGEPLSHTTLTSNPDLRSKIESFKKSSIPYI